MQYIKDRFQKNLLFTVMVEVLKKQQKETISKGSSRLNSYYNRKGYWDKNLLSSYFMSTVNLQKVMPFRRLIAIADQLLLVE